MLRPIALVESKPEILAVLEPLGLARPHARPFAAGPPRPEVAVLLDAGDGAAYPTETPATPPGLPTCLPAGMYPKPRDEAIRIRAATLEPGEDFEQCGFELPPPPATRDAGAAQIEIFAEDDAQPDAAEGEPVFWPAFGWDAYPDDNFIQVGAPDQGWSLPR
jgi:hypothetical protein